MSQRRGVALLFALLVLLLVEAMAAGLIVLAAQTSMVADARLRAKSSDAAARFGAAAVMADWLNGGFDTLANGMVAVPAAGRGSEGDVTWSTTVERLAAALFLVRSEARTGAQQVFARRRTVAVVRVLDRAAALRMLDAALISAGPAVLARASRIAAASADADSSCAAPPIMASALALRVAAPPLVAETVELIGEISVDTTLALANPLANLTWRDIAHLADTTAVDAFELAASDSVYRLIYAPGDLAVSGVGHGIVAAAGVLTLTTGAHITGVILAGEGLSMETGSHVHGAAVSARGHALINDAALTYSACAILRGLRRTPALRRPLYAERRYLPAF